MRIFVSSPDDVAEERILAQGVIQRLHRELGGRATLEAVLWEHEPLLASTDFQSQITKPSDTDIFVAILWSKLGSKLPPHFVREDGSRYESGTEYEFEDAISSFRKNGAPEILVYRKTTPPVAALDDAERVLQRLRAKQAVDGFMKKWFVNPDDQTAIGAFHSFKHLDDFEHLLEAHLRKLVQQRLPKERDGEWTALWTSGSPFRGLEPFEPAHAEVFFGRTRAVSEVIDALREQAARGQAFVLVLGMSGCGKSSLVRAGVLPTLVQPGVVRGVRRWHKAIVRPGEHGGRPLLGLAMALKQLPPFRDTPVAELDAQLHDAPELVAQRIRADVDDQRLALIVDQLEELFTARGLASGEVARFIRALDELTRSGRVWAIATLRSDFYPRCQDHPLLLAMKEGRGSYDLRPPTPNEIGQIIRLPARVAGLAFEEDVDSGERLDDVLRDAATGHPEILPLLQFTLDELYERRSEHGVLTHAAYREIGGVEGSLARRAQHVFDALDAATQDALPHVLSLLITKGAAGTDAPSRVPAHLDDFSPAGKAFVEAFVQARLFVTGLDAEQRVEVNIAHEALIRHWPKLQEWIQENDENLRIHGRVAAAAKHWEQGRSKDLLLPAGKPIEEAQLLVARRVDLAPLEREFIEASRARVRRHQQLRAALGVTLLALTVTTAFGAYLAQRQSSRAMIEAQTAQATTDFLVDLFQVSDPWSVSPLRSTNVAEITAREILDRGAARIDAELEGSPLVRASLLNAIGSVYSGLGLIDESEKLLRQGLELRRGALRPSSAAIGDSLLALGRDRYIAGDYEGSEASLKEALAIYEAAHGESSAQVGAVLDMLSITAANRSRFDEALQIQTRALEIRRADENGDPLALALALNNLGYVQTRVGQPAEAARAFEEAVGILEGLPARGHYSRALANLAAAHQTAGRFAEALALHERALAIKREWFGNDHSETAFSIANLASVYLSLGRYADAKPLFMDAIRIFAAQLGEGHPNVAILHGNLGSVLANAGEHDAAEEAYARGLELLTASLGDRNLNVVIMRNGMGYLRELAGDPEGAAESYREALRIGREIAPNHPEVAMSAAAVAALPGSGLTTEQREQELQAALQRVAESEAGRGPRMAELSIRLARFYAAEGRTERASEFYTEALRILAATVSSDSPRYLERRAEFVALFGREPGQPER
jgi:tetratricopeptide (TPR) repeat protein